MRIIVTFLAILMIAGCTDKDKVPSGILPKEEMGNILWDMIQADQFSSIYMIKDTPRINLKTEDLRLYQQVFRMHQVSRDEFRKSLQYYEDRPELIRTVFDTLLSRGNRLRTEIYSRPAVNPQPAVAAPATPLPSPKTPGKILSPPMKASGRPPVEKPAATYAAP
jgi:hypothetical protein